MKARIDAGYVGNLVVSALYTFAFVALSFDNEKGLLRIMYFPGKR